MRGASGPPNRSSSAGKAAAPARPPLPCRRSDSLCARMDRTKLTSTRGFARKLRSVPGERISPKAIVASSNTMKVPLGERFGVPSGAAVATEPQALLCNDPLHVGCQHGHFSRRRLSRIPWTTNAPAACPHARILLTCMRLATPVVSQPGGASRRDRPRLHGNKGVEYLPIDL